MAMWWEGSGTAVWSGGEHGMDSHHLTPRTYTCVDFHAGAFQRPCSVHFLPWPSIWTAWVWSTGLQRQQRQRLTQVSEETEALIGHINTLEVGGWQCVSHSESFGWLPCCPDKFSSTQTHLQQERDLPIYTTQLSSNKYSRNRLHTPDPSCFGVGVWKF